VVSDSARSAYDAHPALFARFDDDEFHLLMTGMRRVTTPWDDPIVGACIAHGGHFWPTTETEEPQTCTRCWFNPEWKTGEVIHESACRPVRDEPQA